MEGETKMNLAQKIQQQALAAANNDALRAAYNLTKTFVDFPDTRTDPAVAAVHALLLEALDDRAMMAVSRR
jgi:hypothetical protein